MTGVRDGLFRSHVHDDAHFCWLSASVHLGCPPPSSLAARICEFRDQYYVAPRMVIAGAGMKHDVLLELSEKYFGGVSSGSATPIVDKPAEVCNRRRCGCPSINGAHRGTAAFFPSPLCKGQFLERCTHFSDEFASVTLQYLGGCRLYPMEVSPSNNAQGIPLTQLGLGFKV